MNCKLLTAGLLVLLLSACERDYMSERGFSLPEGNSISGQEAFVYLQCIECHSVSGVVLPQVPFADEPYVELGGKVSQIKTYGDLVTSIINPSHKLAEGYEPDEVSRDGVSNMYVYNSYMTVQELIDIVMFLQPHYDVTIPYTKYPKYR